MPTTQGQNSARVIPVLVAILTCVACPILAADKPKKEKWITTTQKLEGAPYTFSYIRFEKPITVQPVPLDKISRKTPEDFMIAAVSIRTHGKGEDGLKRFCSLHENGTAMRKRLARMGYTWEKMSRSREQMEKVFDPAQMFGKIKYRGHILLVAGMRHKKTGSTRYVGVCLKEKNGIYCQADKSKLADRFPFFMHISADDYSVITGGEEKTE